MKPIIGRCYHPAPTLRQMPRHWTISEEPGCLRRLFNLIAGWFI